MTEEEDEGDEGGEDGEDGERGFFSLSHGFFFIFEMLEEAKSAPVFIFQRRILY